MCDRCIFQECEMVMMCGFFLPLRRRAWMSHFSRLFSAELHREQTENEWYFLSEL